MKVAFYTLGCKVNQYETNVMIEKFSKRGYEIVPFNTIADIYVINTCTVTNMSDRKSRQMIQRAKRLNPKSIMVVVGCLAQVGKDKLEQIPEIDLILGNEDKKDIIRYVEEFDKNCGRSFVSDIMKYDKYNVEELSTLYEKTRAIVKIQDGCNNYCSYCIIPYARGKIRSKPFKDVMTEVNNIVKNGYKEIVLTGIHVCSYGKDLGDISLIDVLEKLNQVEGLERIRLSSLEPNIISEEFLQRLSKLEKVCPHFHLSLQSCSDKILKSMNRKYQVSDIERIVNSIRGTYENANITCDIIVGFPGETDEDFECTYNLLEKLKLNKLHVFQYSKREGTVAAKMPNQVEPDIKHERSQRLIKLSDSVEKDILGKYVGRKVKILTEEIDGEYTKGFTDNYLHCKVVGNIQCNEIVEAKVIDIQDNYLICE